MSSNIIEQIPEAVPKTLEGATPEWSESWGPKATPLAVQKIQPWRAWAEPPNIRTFNATCGLSHPDVRLQQQRDEHGGAGG
jgi:hypothetical protein